MIKAGQHQEQRMKQDIKTPGKQRISHWRKLKQRKYRWRENRFLVEGERAVGQVMANSSEAVEALILDEDRAQAVDRSTWMTGDVPCYQVSRRVLQELCDTETPQGMLCVCRMPEMAELQQVGRLSGIIVAADRLQDPVNMAAIIRTATWFSSCALVVSPDTVDPFHPKVVRGTAGAITHLPVVFRELHEAFSELSGLGWRVLLLDCHRGASGLAETVCTRKEVLVVGNEASGVDVELRNQYQSICIERPGARGDDPDTSGGVESLNASVACGIALHHVATEQRLHKQG